MRILSTRKNSHTWLQDGLKALLNVFNGLYDIYISVSYGNIPTRTQALSILTDAVHHSEEGYEYVSKFGNEAF